VEKIRPTNFQTNNAGQKREQSPKILGGGHRQGLRLWGLSQWEDQSRSERLGTDSGEEQEV